MMLAVIPISSYAQRYESKGTKRWGLLNHFARLVTQIKPDIVAMENVPNVTRHDVFRDFVIAAVPVPLAKAIGAAIMQHIGKP